MKKYANDINKLYEQEGFGKLETGKTYVSKKGSKLTINEMYIDANSLVPDVIVDYKFLTPEGKEGEESNRYEVFVDMVRNS